MTDTTEHNKDHLIRELTESVYGVVPKNIDNDGIDLSDFRKDIDFSSGNEDELRRYFNAKVSKFSGLVSLSYDVKPKYWPASFAGTLFLKSPEYVSAYNYQKLGLDKITTTWACTIPNRKEEPNETDKICESVERLNRKIFDQLMSNLSWANYAGKFHMNFAGRLKIDASRLKDLKGIPEMINTTQPLLTLTIENWCGKTLDLSEFEFNKLELYECKFDEIVGLPSELDKLVIRNASKYTPALSLDDCKFEIKFPQRLDNFLCYNDNPVDGILPFFDFGGMTVTHKLCLKNINAIGSVSLLPANYIINVLSLVNINQGYARKYDKELDISVFNSCSFIKIENTKTPTFKNFESSTHELVLSGITDELLTDDSLPPATDTSLFKDCSPNVINLISAKSDALQLNSPYRVFIEGIQQDGDAMLDLRGFKDALVISVNGDQYDRSLIGRDTKKLLIKYPQWSKTEVSIEANEDFKNYNNVDYTITDWFEPKDAKGAINTTIRDFLLNYVYDVDKCLETGTPVCLIHNFFDRLLVIEAEDADLAKTRMIVKEAVLDNPVHLLSKELYDNDTYGIEKFKTVLFSSFCVNHEDRDAFEQRIKNEDYMSFSDKYLDKLLFYIYSVYQATGKLPESIENKLDGAITIDVAREIIDNYKKITNQEEWWVDFNTVTDAVGKKVTEAYHTALFNVASQVASAQLTGGF